MQQLKYFTKIEVMEIKFGLSFSFSQSSKQAFRILFGDDVDE